MGTERQALRWLVWHHGPSFRMDSSTISHLLVMATQQLWTYTAILSLVYSDEFIGVEGLSFKHVGHEAAQKAADSRVYFRQAFHHLLNCFDTICSSVGRFEILLILERRM